MSKKSENSYISIIESIFFQKYNEGDTQVEFLRTDIESTAQSLGVKIPKNLGDLIYSFKFRTQLPNSIKATQPSEREWVLKTVGRSRYAFTLVRQARIIPDPLLATIKIPNSTPSIVEKYALSDEQALLAKLRYNKLVDIFTGVICFSLQNHLRTTVPRIGQVEVDEIYVGLNKYGQQFVIPVQAKGGNDEIGIVQIEQDIELCSVKYPDLICRPLAAQFLDSNEICMFEFTVQDGEVFKISEKHYKLVDMNEISASDLQHYRNLSP